MATKPKPKGYPINVSPLFGISSKKKLAELLGWVGAPSALASFANRSSNYDLFTDRTKPDKPREIEKPKQALKCLQKRLEGLLKRIELPEYLHSGRPGLSYLTNSNAHRDALGATITMDISSFYPSVTEDRLARLFIVEFNCSRDIAEILAKLVCCNGHLATGSPASPLLSFLAFKDVFDDISVRFSGEGTVFTLYVDDIAISAACIGKTDIAWIKKKLQKVKLNIKTSKTKVFRSGKPRLVTGRIIVNGKSRAPNKQHQKLHKSMAEYNKTQDDGKAKSSVVGHMRHIALLDDERREKLKKNAKKISTRQA